MSHFIEGTKVDGPLVFHNNEEKQTEPKIKKFLKNNTLKNFL